MAVLGAGGAVGRRLAATLLRAGGARPRLGVRNPGQAVLPDGGNIAEVMPVDPASLDALMDGAAVLVNCIGAGYRARSRIALAALARAVPYLDPSGDEGLATRISGAAGRAPLPVPLLLGAGAVPGASGLLARWLAAGLRGQAGSLTGYVLTLEPLHAATATEFLLALVAGGPAAIRGLATAIRGLATAIRGLATAIRTRGDPGPGHGDPGPGHGDPGPGHGDPGQPLPGSAGLRLPYASGALDAFPNASREARAVSRDLGTRTCFFQAFESGGAILPFLSSVGRRRDDGATVRQLAGELTAVVATELAGRAPLHLIAWEAGPHAVRPASPAGSADVVRSAVLRAGSSYQLTASMLALAVRELLAGRVPPACGTLTCWGLSSSASCPAWTAARAWKPDRARSPPGRPTRRRLGRVPWILVDAGGDPGGVRQGGGGADSGAIGDDDNAAGRRLGADPRRRRSTGHARLAAASRAAASRSLSAWPLVRGTRTGC